MKRFTLEIEMRCNQYCVFCGLRAVDDKVISVRRAHGLSVPRASAGSSFGDLVHRSADWTRGIAQRLGGKPRAPRAEARSIHGGFSREAAFRELDRVRARGFEGLSLQGGEPTLWPWLPELVAHGRKIGFEEITIVTNGRILAEPGRAEELYGAGLSHVTFSLLGPDAATHDGLTLFPGSFDCLLRAVDNANDWSRGHPGQLHVAANVVVSAENIDALADMVALLAVHGAEAITLHLVRFSLFADDRSVRARLQFPLSRLREPLAAAVRETARHPDLHLHAGDVPLCQHAYLRPDDLEWVLGRTRNTVLHARRPYEHYVTTKGAFKPNASGCRSCIVRSGCRIGSMDYIRDAEDALRPIDASTIAADLDARSDSGPDARHVLEEIAASIVLLAAEGALAGSDLARALEALRGAFGRLIEDAAARGDAAEAHAAFYGALGLHAPSDPGPVDQLLAAGDERTIDPPGPELGTRIVFAPGFELRAETSPNGDAVALHGLVPIPPPPGVPGGVAARRLFLRDIWGRLQGARRLRWTPETIEIDSGAGLVPVFARAAPWAVTIEPPTGDRVAAPPRLC